MYKKLNVLGILAFSAITFSTNAALYDRGNGMIYDDVLNITWLQDARYQQPSTWGLANWNVANELVSNLVYGGYDDWRLPSAKLRENPYQCNGRYGPFDGSCDSSYNNTNSELGHMYYNNLGNVGYYDPLRNITTGYGFINATFVDAATGRTVSFLNVPVFPEESGWKGDFWFAEGVGHPNNSAYMFYGNSGRVGRDAPIAHAYAWAVRDGDVVSAVPLPPAAFLFGCALVALITRKIAS